MERRQAVRKRNSQMAISKIHSLQGCRPREKPNKHDKAHTCSPPETVKELTNGGNGIQWNRQKETLFICRAFQMLNRVRNPKNGSRYGNDFDVAVNELVKNLWIDKEIIHPKISHRE